VDNSTGGALYNVATSASQLPVTLTNTTAVGSGNNFNGVPTGSCTANTTAINTITGDIYVCKNSVWTLNLYSANSGSFYPGITMFGTSLTQPCNGVGAIRDCYASLLANDVGGGLYRNWARAGDQMADLGRVWVYPNIVPQLTGNTQYTIEIGVNDANVANGHAYTTVNQQANYTNMLNAIIAWLGTPQSNSLGGANCTQTSGVWAQDNATFTPYVNTEQSTTNGSVLTCTYTSTGPTIYLWYRMIDGKAGSASVTLDGGAVGTINGFGQNGSLISTLNSTTDSVGVLRIPATVGSHAVAITVTSATNANNIVSVLGVGSAPALTEYNLPAVYVMGVAKEQSDQNSALTATLNGLNSAAVPLATSDGLNVKFVDARAYINPATDYSDQLHPNVAGNLHLRDAFEFAMRPSGLAIGLGMAMNTGNLTSLYDNFVRANGVLGSPNWNGSVGLTVTGNLVFGNVAATYNIGLPGTTGLPSRFVWSNYNTGLLAEYIIGRDQFSRMRIAGAVGAATIPFVRVLDAGGGLTTTGAFYQYDCSNTARRIVRSAAVVLGTVAASCNVGDEMMITVQGNNITGWYCANGGPCIQDIQVNDNLGAPYGTPDFGIYGNGTAAINNWTGGSLSTLATTDIEQEWQAPQKFKTIGTTGACTNAELALSAGWQSTGAATVTAVQGTGQTCSWTITTGTTTAASPTVTDTLINALPNLTTVCEMNIHGGTHAAIAGEGFTQTTFSNTVPVFTFIGTPGAAGVTYFVTRRCGP